MNVFHQLIYILWPPLHDTQFQGIPYTTEWVDCLDIGSLCKNLGIPPTSKNADGSDRYTLPDVHDPSAAVYISDSILIAEYLEKTTRIFRDSSRTTPSRCKTYLGWGLVVGWVLWSYHLGVVCQTQSSRGGVLLSHKARGGIILEANRRYCAERWRSRHPVGEVERWIREGAMPRVAEMGRSSLEMWRHGGISLLRITSFGWGLSGGKIVSSGRIFRLGMAGGGLIIEALERYETAVWAGNHYTCWMSSGSYFPFHILLVV